ncbi:MAG: (d)CMP kinase [Gammaproteobacteria bacterium]
MPDTSIPVIAIDGPSGSGKGTISQIVAQELGWNFLDSGALYRLVALAAQQQRVSLDNEATLARLALHLNAHFISNAHLKTELTGVEATVTLDDRDVTRELRSQECAEAASRVAALPEVRVALLDRQRAFRVAPGLVADGRDMGSVVFADAALKIFLTASVEERAFRRHKQLIGKGMNVNIPLLEQELAGRDARDCGRSIAPLKAVPDAVLIDSSNLSIKEVVQDILSLWQNTPFKSQTLT